MTTRPSRFALIALGVSLSAAAGGTANAAEMMDHSMHQTPPAEAAQAPASSAKPAAKNHGSGGQTDHSAMGHGAMDHSTMNHGQMKHDDTLEMPGMVHPSFIPVLTDADREAADRKSVV